MPDRRVNTVIKALHIHTQYSIKVRFECVLCIADVRNAGVIYQNVDAIMAEDFGKPRHHLGLISNVACVRRSSASCARDFRCNRLRVLCADVNNMDSCTINPELVRNRPANAAPAARNDCRLPVEPKLAAIAIFAGQRETPRFQGMKSS